MIYVMRTIMVVFVLLGIVTHDVHAVEPIITDSRIKTFVYNENDVFTLTTHYGYQSNIEFAKNERIETVSLGDRVAWQIVPAGRRLFVRPQEENVTTNMTVITNKRAYQFDLRAEAGQLKPNAQLAYVVRFYYPEDMMANLAGQQPPIPAAAQIPAAPAVPRVAPSYSSPAPAMAPITSAPLPPAASGQVAPQRFSALPQQPRAAASAPSVGQPAAPSVNLNYTYTGPDNIAPLKVFDDGKVTFFRFQNYKGQKVPALSIPSKSGNALPVQVKPTEKGYWMAPMVSKQFQMRYDGAGDIVTVYNEGS